MSATNRGAKRAEADYYKTPAWCVRRILELESFVGVNSLPPGWPDVPRILEPCAGDGAIVRVMRELGIDGEIHANELRNVDGLHEAGADFTTFGDYLAWPALRSPMPQFELGITNPPFGLAEPIIRQMLTHCDYVVVLVRQGFVGHARAAWMRDDMPDTYELPDRPSFVGKAVCRECGFDELVPHGTEQFCGCGAKMRVSMATDAADYCWLVWTPERGRKWGRRYILPSTPLAERKAG